VSIFKRSTDARRSPRPRRPPISPARARDAPRVDVAQNIRIWSVTATEPRLAEAVQNGGTARVLPNICRHSA
jgi:hypothetical protein